MTKRTGKASRLLLIAMLLLGLGLGAMPHPAARAATPGLPLVEDFSDDALRDASLTNANWSTDEQALTLAWRRAQYGAFGEGLTGSDFGDDPHPTFSVALGDLDGDGVLLNSHNSARTPTRPAAKLAPIAERLWFTSGPPLVNASSKCELAKRVRDTRCASDTWLIRRVCVRLRVPESQCADAVAV